MGKTISPWGRQCKAQMIVLGISLKDLAKSVGLSPNYVSAIINGRMIAPEENVQKISDTLQVDLTSVQ